MQPQADKQLCVNVGAPVAAEQSADNVQSRLTDTSSAVMQEQCHQEPGCQRARSTGHRCLCAQTVWPQADGQLCLCRHDLAAEENRDQLHMPI